MLSNNIVVPFIDKTFLDISHARKILKEENPLLLTEIMPVDIENIITKKGLNITNTHISKDKSIGKGNCIHFLKVFYEIHVQFFVIPLLYQHQ